MQDDFPLPSNGWLPGRRGLVRAAARHGLFHAELTDHGAEAWLGERREAMVWPDGWRVAFNPTRLIDPSGEVFALEGDFLRVGGGLDAQDRFSITSKIDRRTSAERKADAQAEADEASKRRGGRFPPRLITQ